MRTQLDVAWMGLRDGVGRVSGNLLDEVTSVIQFDDVSAMVALCSHTEREVGSTEGQWILQALLPGREPHPWPSLQQFTVTLQVLGAPPPLCSQISSCAQSEQVHHMKIHSLT